MIVVIVRVVIATVVIVTVVIVTVVLVTVVIVTEVLVKVVIVTLLIVTVVIVTGVKVTVVMRKAPQFKWSCMDRTNVQNLLVQMDDGPMDRLCYVNLDRPNGCRSDGPAMLRQFGPSKSTTVQWTA